MIIFIDVLLCLKKDLNLKKIPFLIDCFDVSTLQEVIQQLLVFVLKMENPLKKL